MISYFKYDRGNAFLLNGQPYDGFIHIENGKAYTGKVADTFTRELSSTGNFLAEFYLREMEFDVTADDATPAAPFVLNSFDILNKTHLDQAFDRVNDNNLLVFKHLVIQNPNLFATNRTNTHFYGLSSTDADIRNSDVPSGKRSYTHIDPFSFDSEWAFLDNITSGDFIVDFNDTFLYFCTDGTTQYTLSGSFVTTEPIALLAAHPTSTFYIKQDTIDNRLFITSLTGIDILDLQNFINCQTYNILDSITIDIDPEHKDLVKIGRNIRTEVNDDILYFKNKYSTEIYDQVTFAILGVDDILTIDIREVDDLIIFLATVGTDIYFGSFDPSDRDNTYILEPISNVTVNSTLLFSSVDSNIFYTLTDAVIQGRMLTKPQYFFGTTKSDTYFYLDDYLYGTTRENWNQIQIKYNSNSLPSNSFNNLLFRTVPIDTTQYLLTHNIGRIYVSKLTMENTYVNSVPLNIQKSYTGTQCSESSFGLFFNVTISNLVKDTLRLYGLAAETYSLSGSTLTKGVLSDLEFEIGNLYLNGNESVNIVSIQRILSLINFIQNELIS